MASLSHDTYHAAYAAGNNTTTTNLPFVLHEYDGDSDEAHNTTNTVTDPRATNTMTTAMSLTDYHNTPTDTDTAPTAGFATRSFMASLPTEDDSSLLWLFSQPFLLHRNQSLTPLGA